MTGKLLGLHFRDRRTKAQTGTSDQSVNAANQPDVTWLPNQPHGFLLGVSDATTNTVTCPDTHTACELGISIISLLQGG